MTKQQKVLEDIRQMLVDNKICGAVAIYSPTEKVGEGITDFVLQMLAPYSCVYQLDKQVRIHTKHLKDLEVKRQKIAQTMNMMGSLRDVTAIMFQNLDNLHKAVEKTIEVKHSDLKDLNK